MTAQSERLKEAHRGHRMAEPASRSRIRSLEQTGHAFEVLDDCTVVVVGKYLLNPAASHWHLIDDPSVHGYLISSLDAEIRKNRNPEKPAAGRDSVATSDRTAASTTAPEIAIAESAAGPLCAAPAPRLPEVSWP